MKKRLSITLIISLICILIIPVNVQARTETKTCAWGGCDTRITSSSGSRYCHVHKCSKISCKNAKYKDGYCTKHYEEAQKKNKSKEQAKSKSSSGTSKTSSSKSSSSSKSTGTKKNTSTNKSASSSSNKSTSKSKNSSSKKSTSTKKSTSSKKKTYSDSYNEGYDDIYMDEDYDEERYRKDDDYARGVDDAMEDAYDDFGDEW